MKRDFEIIRNILFQLESSPAGRSVNQLGFDEAMEDAVIGEHLEIMIQSNLITGKVLSCNPLAFSVQLAWKGHDFIENARNDTVWKRVIAEAKEKGTSTTLVILEGLLSKAAEKYAGLGSDNPPA